MEGKERLAQMLSADGDALVTAAMNAESSDSDSEYSDSESTEQDAAVLPSSSPGMEAMEEGDEESESHTGELDEGGKRAADAKSDAAPKADADAIRGAAERREANLSALIGGGGGS